MHYFLDLQKLYVIAIALPDRSTVVSLFTTSVQIALSQLYMQTGSITYKCEGITLMRVLLGRVFTRHISDQIAIGTGPVARVQTRSSRSSRSGFSRTPLDVIGSDRDRSRPLCVRSTLSCERATSRS